MLTKYYKKNNEVMMIKKIIKTSFIFVCLVVLLYGANQVKAEEINSEKKVETVKEKKAKKDKAGEEDEEDFNQVIVEGEEDIETSIVEEIEDALEKEVELNKEKKNEKEDKPENKKEEKKEKLASNKNIDEKPNLKVEQEEKKEKSVIKYTDDEFKLLVATMYAEGGNQPYKTKLMYANSIINRVKSKTFPNTIKGVVYQYLVVQGKRSYQYSVARPGGTLEKHLKLYGKRQNSAERKLEEECVKAAKAALQGENPLGNYTSFRLSSPSFRDFQPDGIVVGPVYFYNYHWRPYKKK